MDSACKDPHGEHEKTYDVMRELLPEEVLGIMDQLLRHEVGSPTRPFSPTTDWLGQELANALLDGVASRLPPIPDALHECIHRRDSDAYARNDPGGRLPKGAAAWVHMPAAASDSQSVLRRFAKDLFIRSSSHRHRVLLRGQFLVAC